MDGRGERDAKQEGERLENAPQCSCVSRCTKNKESTCSATHTTCLRQKKKRECGCSSRRYCHQQAPSRYSLRIRPSRCLSALLLTSFWWGARGQPRRYKFTTTYADKGRERYVHASAGCSSCFHDSILGALFSCSLSSLHILAPPPPFSSATVIPSSVKSLGLTGSKYGSIIASAAWIRFM